MDKLYNWIFHYNPYRELWEATKRDNYQDLFNNPKSSDIIRSSNVMTLVEIIRKTNGNKNKIKELL